MTHAGEMPRADMEETARPRISHPTTITLIHSKREYSIIYTRATSRISLAHTERPPPGPDDNRSSVRARQSSAVPGFFDNVLPRPADA